MNTFLLAVTVAFAGLAFESVRGDDVPDRDRRLSATRSTPLAGMYKVAASSDPFFPQAKTHEWFLDFGKGVTSEKSSGTVAVSLRQNPNVKVRIMVWQMFPQTGTLLLGHQFDGGSRKAAAVADWQISQSTAGIVLERGQYQIVLRRADPKDY